eukprot:3038121-Karenia_brevis.AAC.1
MNVIYAESDETTINTTKRFLESRVRDISLGEAEELNENESRVHMKISESNEEINLDEARE